MTETGVLKRLARPLSVMALYDAAKPLLFGLDPETAHRSVKGLLKTAQDTRLEGVLADHYTVVDSRLRVDAFGEIGRASCRERV